MASAYSSDEESDLTPIPDSVIDYQFVDEEEEPISFSDLPLDDPASDSPQVYLRGTTQDGLQKVYEPVAAWRIELSRKLGPDVSVLASTNKKWIKLVRPRKAYESIIRGVLISVQALHYLKWNPDSAERSLWDNLKRVFAKFEVRPSEDDFGHHITFMKQFAEKDEILANSQILKGFLEGKGRRRTGEGNSGVPEIKQPFIAEDDEVEVIDAEEDESDEEDDELFDSVCSICDNGGELLCCDGECMRSFHATEEAGDDSNCESLGLTRAQVDAIQSFLCENCKVKQHQCFACGKLGNSDKSKGAEVFQCRNATCGYFYHPSCVAKLLFPDEEAAASEREKTVLEGNFVCPSHQCAVCKEREDKADPDLQFAVCRRCPKSYHRKCLPRKISFSADDDNGILQRAWDDLLPNRILIYCLKHKIDKKLMTPNRDHIVFPGTQARKKVGSSEVLSRKQKRPIPKHHGSPIRTNWETSPSDMRPLKKRAVLHDEIPSSKVRDVGHPSHPGKGKAGSIRKVKKLRENDSSRDEIGGSTSIKNVKKLRENNLFREEASGTAVGLGRSPSPRELAKSDLPSCSGKIPYSTFPVIDAATENKMKEFLEKESVTVNDVLKRQIIPRTHQHSGRQIEKVTRGKIVGSVEAIQAAYQRIISGGSVNDAKAICEPEVVKQVFKWHKRMGVYLSPFMHGMRYTSFGRHFTKEEKLQEICNKLQWYVKNNDTIVDFCCGSNDFSRIMKEKMDALGKKCNYRNYDIVPPKNDFWYEKRDWMTVLPKELPNGESLIMGLNPPFGTKAGLANKFIDKALTFKPKLIILIVPKETERLDQKRTPYDLVWVDSVMLSGMSFYLPGSVDVNDKQMEQWNVTPPLLYLWSRPDWTARHKGIAEEHGHFSELAQDMTAPPPLTPPPSEEEQREAEDIISQVVGDISVIKNEQQKVMRQEEYASFSKGKDKLAGVGTTAIEEVRPGSSQVENPAKIEPSILKQKEGNDAGVGTTVVEEVNKSNERKEMRQQGYVTFSKEKDKLLPDSREVEKRAKTEPSIQKQKEGNDAGVSTTVIEENKFNDRNQGRRKKESLEGTGSQREARGINQQSEGRGGTADQNSGSHLNEARANKLHNEGTVHGSREEYTDNRYHNGGASQVEPRVVGNHNNFREAGPHRIGKLPDMREGGSYNNKRSPDRRGTKRSSPEMRPSVEGGSYNNKRSPDRRGIKRSSPEMRPSVEGGSYNNKRSPDRRGIKRRSPDRRGIKRSSPEMRPSVEGGSYNNKRSPDRRGIKRSSPEMRPSVEGSSYNNKRSPDRRGIKRSSPEMRPNAASDVRISPPGVIDSRSGKMRQSEARAAGTLDDGNISDMDISSPDNNRQHASAMRGDYTATWENKNNHSRNNSTSSRGNDSIRQSENNNNHNYNNSRYDCGSNRGSNTLQRENNNTECEDTLPLPGSQYINNDPLMEQLIEMRQLDSHLDFSDLGPILSNGNDDLNDIARQYPTSSSYDWPYGGSGLASGSGFLEHSHPRIPDYMDPGVFDDFEGLGRFYGSHDDNRHNNFGVGATGQSGHPFHNSASIPSYGLSGLSGSTSTSLPSYGLSGLGGGTSTSALDRYAPRLDETNFLRPGGSVGGSRQFHQGAGGFGGGLPPNSYEMHGLDARDMPPPDYNLPGYGSRQFQPRPSSSGGWLGD